MYKCTDCGKEYKDKPPFCECGNNNFEEIGIISASAKKETNKKVIKKNSDETTSGFQIPTEPKKDYTYIILSCILGLCILLIIIGIFHLKNISKTETKTAKNVQEQTEISKHEASQQQSKEINTEQDNSIYIPHSENKIEIITKETAKPASNQKTTAKQKAKAEPKKQSQTPVKPKQTQTKLPKITQTQSQPIQKQTQPQPATTQPQVQKPSQPQQNTQTQNPSKYRCFSI